MIKTLISRLRRDEHGASMVEYAVALLVVTAAGVALMSTLGDQAGYNVSDACEILATGKVNGTTDSDCS